MMKKTFSLLMALMLLLSLLAMPVSASETEESDWDFSEEYPTVPSTGVTINVYNWGEYISNGTEGSLDVNAELPAARALRSTTPRSTATNPCIPSWRAAVRITM